MNKSIDFSGAWESFWSKVHLGISPEAQQIISWVALAILVMAMWQWLWARHKGGRSSGLIWAIIIAAVIAAPERIIPAVLEVIDQAWAIVLSVF